MSARRLIFAPYVGEFGWELLNWQGRVRWLVRRTPHHVFSEIIVFCGAGRREIYADLVDDPTDHPDVCLREMELAAIPGEPNDDHRIDADGRPIAPTVLRDAVHSALRTAGIDLDDACDRVVSPDYRGTLFPTGPAHQAFATLGNVAEPEIDVLLVPRHRAHAAERGLPREWWRELHAELSDRGLFVATYAAPLRHAIAQLSAARLAAGGSTGGLHLASLVGCPHYVWGPGDEARWTAIGMSNRQRYQTIWNPLGTPVCYDRLGWQPDVDRAAAGIVAALEQIGRGRRSSAADWTQRFRWRIRRGLARVWARDARSGVAPWRLRELIRTHLS